MSHVQDADGDGRHATEDGEVTATSGRSPISTSSLSMMSASYSSHHAEIKEPIETTSLWASTESQMRLPSDIVSAIIPTAIASNTGTPPRSSVLSKITAGDIAGLTLGTMLALAVISGLLVYFLKIKSCLRHRKVRRDIWWEMVNTKQGMSDQDNRSGKKVLSPSSVSLKDSLRRSASARTGSSTSLSQTLSLAERRGVSRPQALSTQRCDSVGSTSVHSEMINPFEKDVSGEKAIGKISFGPLTMYNGSISGQVSNPHKFENNDISTTKFVGNIPGGSRALYQGSELQAEMHKNVISQSNYRVHFTSPVKGQDESEFEFEPDEDVLFGVAYCK